MMDKSMKCRLCGNENLIFYYTQGNADEFKYYKCSDCALVNYDLSGGLDQIKYTSMVYISPTDMSLKQNIDQSDTYNFIKKHSQKIGKMMDIGCGNGKILLLAAMDGWEVKGLELSELLAYSINERYGIEVTVSNFLDYEPEEEESYDVVILRHVLEHLPDSILAMRKINALLKPGGLGVLEFPDIESNEMKFKRFLQKFGLNKKKYRKGYVPGHCNEFCKESFRFLLKKTGFNLLKWQNYSSKKYMSSFYNLLHLGSKARVLIQKTVN